MAASLRLGADSGILIYQVLLQITALCEVLTLLQVKSTQSSLNSGFLRKP